jgi:hypothetical protein
MVSFNIVSLFIAVLLALLDPHMVESMRPLKILKFNESFYSTEYRVDIRIQPPQEVSSHL